VIYHRPIGMMVVVNGRRIVVDDSVWVVVVDGGAVVVSTATTRTCGRVIAVSFAAQPMTICGGRFVLPGKGWQQVLMFAGKVAVGLVHLVVAVVGAVASGDLRKAEIRM
jgi:hypothetical protein